MPSLLKAFLARSTIVNGNNLNSVCMGVRRLYQEGTLGRGHLPFPGKLDSHWSLTISITVLKCAKSALISTLKFKMFFWGMVPRPYAGERVYDAHPIGAPLRFATLASCCGLSVLDRSQ